MQENKINSSRGTHISTYDLTSNIVATNYELATLERQLPYKFIPSSYD